MAGGTGSLNSSGCPEIEIEVEGGLQSRHKITALVDTGFSGFLSIPLLEAFPIGLILHGTTNVILADGNKHAKFTCLGMVHFGGEMQGGVIVVEPVGDIALVGMEFLKKFKLTLFTDPDIPAVFLLSSDVLKQALSAAKIMPPSAGTTPTSTSSGTPPSTPSPTSLPPKP